jgi:hypothetical protein
MLLSKKKLKKTVLKKIFAYDFYRFNPYIHYFLNLNLSYILHLIYYQIAIFINVTQKVNKSKKINFFLKNGFYKRILKKNDYYFSLFNYLDAELKKKSMIENDNQILCHLDNYFFDNMASKSDSQSHLDDIPNKILKELDYILRKDKYFENIIKFYFKCNYKITNLRIWRYHENSKNNLKNEVGFHHDSFPHKTLKIMVYKGIFSKNNPCLLISDPYSKKIIHSFKGCNPIIIFDPNHLYHGANFPIKDRDTIEITVQPTIKTREPIYGGFSAGYSINPFKKNNNKKFFSF